MDEAALKIIHPAAELERVDMPPPSPARDAVFDVILAIERAGDWARELAGAFDRVNRITAELNEVIARVAQLKGDIQREHNNASQAARAFAQLPHELAAALRKVPGLGQVWDRRIDASRIREQIKIEAQAGVRGVAEQEMRRRLRAAGVTKEQLERAFPKGNND